MNKTISGTNNCQLGNIDIGDFVIYETSTYSKFLEIDNTIIKIVNRYKNRYDEDLVKVVKKQKVVDIIETKSGKTVSIVTEDPSYEKGFSVFYKGLKTTYLFN